MKGLKNNKNSKKLIPLGIAVLVALGLVFAGWGTVYAAQDAQPDDLLYPVKVAFDYLADLTGTVPGNVISIQKTDRDMDAAPVDSEDKLMVQNRNQKGAPADAIFAEPSLDDLDLPIDDTLVTTPTITGTQTMSGSLWGPGPCLGGPENCELDLTAPHGYTYTHGAGDDEAQFKGEPPLGGPPATENPGDNDIGFGPGESTTKEAQEPSENKGSTGEQKKGGK